MYDAKDNFWQHHAEEMRKARLLQAAAALNASEFVTESAVRRAFELEELIEKRLKQENMARAKKSAIEVTKIVVEKEDRVVLELTQDEAQTLFDIYGLNVVGSGRRVLTSNVYYALKYIGFRPSDKTDRTGFVEFHSS